MNKHIEKTLANATNALEEARKDKAKIQEEMRIIDRQNSTLFMRKNNIMNMTDDNRNMPHFPRPKSAIPTEKQPILSTQEVDKLKAELVDLDVAIEELQLRRNTTFEAINAADRVIDVLAKTAMYLMAPETMCISIRDRYESPSCEY